MITLADTTASLSVDRNATNCRARAVRLSKRFCRDLRNSWHYGLQEIVTELACGTREDPQLRAGEFWALNDVSFDITGSQSLAVIGSNGAGKTTLLKLIAGLIRPDKGELYVHGRVVPLLVLGAGFRRNLSGRENISANLALYGLTTSEIRENFDDVLAFAELGEFIDSPVHTYSSGMFMRLGFACAVHTNPDLLLMDEVMAVGDYRFQRKCIRKLKELQSQGTALVITSHNRSTLLQICDTAMYLDKGRLLDCGPAQTVIDAYQNEASALNAGLSSARKLSAEHERQLLTAPLSEFSRSSVVVHSGPVPSVEETKRSIAQKGGSSPGRSMMNESHGAEAESSAAGSVSAVESFLAPKHFATPIPWHRAKRKMFLWHEAPIENEDDTTYGATLELPDGSLKKLWYKVPAKFSSAVTSCTDPFLVGMLFPAMLEKDSELIVHGRVSPSLLTNIMDFQNAWNCWCGDRYYRTEIIADAEIEATAASPSGRAICGFSGGLDSSFTVYRHRFLPMERQQREIEAGLLVRGFVVKEERSFNLLAQRCKTVLDSAGVELITISTNFREMNPQWTDTHGAGLASCLMLFQKRFTEGVIAGTYAYNQLLLPWGSNPVTDRQLSSNAFRIFHDAPHWHRGSKLSALRKWPEAYNNLTVCLRGDYTGENCCRCIKCINTLLAASMNDMSRPASFPVAISKEAIMSLRDLQESDMFGLDKMLQSMRRSSLPRELVMAFQRCVRYNRRRLVLESFNKRTGCTLFGKVIHRLYQRAGIHFPF